MPIGKASRFSGPGKPAKSGNIGKKSHGHTGDSLNDDLSNRSRTMFPTTTSTTTTTTTTTTSTTTTTT